MNRLVRFRKSPSGGPDILVRAKQVVRIGLPLHPGESIVVRTVGRAYAIEGIAAQK